MENMKAVRVHNYGGPEVLRFEDAPRPTPGSGELLIRVYAVSVNPLDWKVRAT
jgi:NADPH:quinone reductase-like Zn-dependent oxidoreductase